MTTKKNDPIAVTPSASAPKPGTKQDKKREHFVERKVLCAKHFDLMIARGTNLSQATARFRHYARANDIEWDQHVCCAVGDGIVNDAIQDRPVRVKPHQDPTKPTKIKKSKASEASESVETRG